MCKDFSCIVTQSYQVAWKRGMSSHDQIYSAFVDSMPELKDHRSIKVEITPDEGYLQPEKGWTLKVDEPETPSWWSASHAKEAFKAHREWKAETYALINIDEARNPINPLNIRKHKPTKSDIELLKTWDSVWASVWDSVGALVGALVGASVWASVGALVGASVWTSVGASVWAYTGSLFNIWGDTYKFQPAVDLWKRGFIPSFDGKTWRLHSGKKAEIVYEWTPNEK